MQAPGGPRPAARRGSWREPDLRGPRDWPAPAARARASLRPRADRASSAELSRTPGASHARSPKVDDRRHQQDARPAPPLRPPAAGLPPLSVLLSQPRARQRAAASRALVPWRPHRVRRLVRFCSSAGCPLRTPVILSILFACQSVRINTALISDENCVECFVGASAGGGVSAGAPPLHSPGGGARGPPVPCRGRGDRAGLQLPRPAPPRGCSRC